MGHNHGVYDSDTHFTINAITRQIKSDPKQKTTVIQYDHNSERFTFECPRYIEGHDMSKCNDVKVHFLNVDAKTKEEKKDAYTVDDLRINPEDENTVLCSWLISNRATQLVGSLSFVVCYGCTENGAVTYAWNTAVATVSVSTGINAGDSVVEEYSDVLAKWKAELFAAGYINASTMQGEIATLKSRMDTFTKLPNGSTSGDAELQDIRVGAGGEAYDSAGTAVREQVGGIKEMLFDEVTYIHNVENTIVPQLSDGFVRYANGEISEDSFGGYYKRTDYIYVPLFCSRIAHNFTLSEGVDGIAFFDYAKRYISGTNVKGTIEEIPEGARFVMFSNYDNTRLHSGKAVKIYAENVKRTECTIQKLVSFGDSHVARELWQSRVVNHFNIKKHINLGVGGSTIAVNKNASVLPFVADERIDAIKSEDPDTIIVIGGTNDVHLETPLGGIDELKKSIDTKNKETFYGAYSFLVEALLTWKPTLQIILCTTPQGFYDNIHPVKYSEVSQAIREIASHYSLPLADIFAECGINKINLATYSDDLIHYNEKGNARVSSVIINTIDKSYLANR